MNRLVAPARSLGLKLILVGALAFILWIPCLMIYALVWERSTRADGVRSEIYELSGGAQTISGPIVIVPAEIDTGKRTTQGEPVTRRVTVAFTPQKLSIDASVSASVRKRSIFDATVYDADLAFEGNFGPLIPPRISDGVATYFWDDAELIVKFANETALKGVRANPVLSVDGKPVAGKFEPGITIEPGDDNIYAAASGVRMPLPIVDPAAGFRFSLTMPLSGGGAISFSPVGEETTVKLSADWPHPSFQGARLPDARDISAEGFTAEWRIPYLARSLPRSFIADPGLVSLESGKAFGVGFVMTDSPYQSVNRALKYALMFVGIVFLTFFLIEATMGGRAHPAQYILLGLAQVVFYLLVLAFAEHIGFETAFIGASGATVCLSGLYAATVFRSFWRGIIAFLAFSGAYGLIYLLMKSEDYALLIGSVAAFGAVALTMAVTRNLDWYGARVEETLTQTRAD
ncbi:MAG: cell envelope integrity protein CreD [Parvularculaceae bacterium]